MTQAPSIATFRTLHAWKRLPLSVRLVLGVMAMIGAILLTVAVDKPSNLPAAANAAVAAPAVRDPSVPDAGQALSGVDRQEEVPVLTF